MELADLLECSICLEQLGESNKVLPCQHTFCTQCLQDVFNTKEELLCPECRTKVTVDIASLPPNILVNRLLEGMKLSRQNKPNNTPDSSTHTLNPVNAPSCDILVPTKSRHFTPTSARAPLVPPSSSQAQLPLTPVHHAPHNPSPVIQGQLATLHTPSHLTSVTQGPLAGLHTPSTHISSSQAQLGTPHTLSHPASVIQRQQTLHTPNYPVSAAQGPSQALNSTPTTNLLSPNPSPVINNYSNVSNGCSNGLANTANSGVNTLGNNGAAMRVLDKSGEVKSIGSSTNSNGGGGNLTRPVVDDKCMVSFSMPAYQNILPQPIIKDNGNNSWSSSLLAASSIQPVGGGSKPSSTSHTPPPILPTSITATIGSGIALTSTTSTPGVHVTNLPAHSFQSTKMSTSVSLQRKLDESVASLSLLDSSLSSSLANVKPAQPQDIPANLSHTARPSISSCHLQHQQNSKPLSISSTISSSMTTSLTSVSSIPAVKTSSAALANTTAAITATSKTTTTVVDYKSFSNTFVEPAAVSIASSSSSSSVVQPQQRLGSCSASSSAQRHGPSSVPIAGGPLSSDSSPVHVGPIPGNLRTNPFLDLLEAEPTHTTSNHRTSISLEPSPTIGHTIKPQQPVSLAAPPSSCSSHPVSTAMPSALSPASAASLATPPTPCPSMATANTSAVAQVRARTAPDYFKEPHKQWQLSPRAILDPLNPTSEAITSQKLKTVPPNQLATPPIDGVPKNAITSRSATATAAMPSNGGGKFDQARYNIEIWNIGGQQLSKNNNSVHHTHLATADLLSETPPQSQPILHHQHHLNHHANTSPQLVATTSKHRQHQQRAARSEAAATLPRTQETAAGTSKRSIAGDLGGHREGELYQAVCEYTARQRDELSLKKGDLYLVTEQCQDGWFRGKHVKSGDTGVFPGNHMQRCTSSSRIAMEAALIDYHQTAAEENDAERLEKLRKIRETLKKTHAQNIARSNSGAAGHVRSKNERYRCVATFPACSDYEIELKVGDIISLVKKREDGWCKGILHRTGKTGLFPASFVERIG